NNSVSCASRPSVARLSRSRERARMDKCWCAPLPQQVQGQGLEIIGWPFVRWDQIHASTHKIWYDRLLPEAVAPETIARHARLFLQQLPVCSPVKNWVGNRLVNIERLASRS